MGKESIIPYEVPLTSRVKIAFKSVSEESIVEFDENDSFSLTPGKKEDLLFLTGERDFLTLTIKRLGSMETKITIFDKEIQIDRGTEVRIRVPGENIMDVPNTLVLNKSDSEEFLDKFLPWLIKCVKQGKIGEGVSIFNPHKMRVPME